MIRAIEQVVRDNPPRIDRHLAEILGAYVGEPDLLSGIACPADETRYARHLLHAGDLYSVLAIVWMPGQMSPVHGHKTWCALGVHLGTLTEALFRPASGGGWGLDRVVQRHPGAVSHMPENAPLSHRVANLGTTTAISIHVYGAAFDRLGREVNRIWAS